MTTIVKTKEAKSTAGLIVAIIILSIIALGATALAVYYIVIISDPTKLNQKNVKKTTKRQDKQNKKSK